MCMGYQCHEYVWSINFMKRCVDLSISYVSIKDFKTSGCVGYAFYEYVYGLWILIVCISAKDLMTI